jgi:hypothetical protein
LKELYELKEGRDEQRSQSGTPEDSPAVQDSP